MFGAPFNACKKESTEIQVNSKVDEKNEFQSSSSIEIDFNELTTFLNGDTIENALLTQMIDSDLVPYGYFNPDYDIHNIYYFSEEALFLSFIENKPEEDDILEIISLADSLYFVIDENDTSEIDFGNNLRFKNRDRNVDRRLTLLAKDAYKGENFTGERRSFYGPRANLGSNWNNQISSIQVYGPGVYMWCHLTRWRETRMIYPVFSHYDIPILPSRHNNRFKSYF